MRHVEGDGRGDGVVLGCVAVGGEGEGEEGEEEEGEGGEMHFGALLLVVVVLLVVVLLLGMEMGVMVGVPRREGLRDGWLRSIWGSRRYWR